MRHQLIMKRSLQAALILILATGTLACAQSPGQRQGPASQQAYPPESEYPKAQGYAPNYSPPVAPGQPQPVINAPPPPQSAASMSIGQWFAAYDQIRHQAQMSPVERRNADALLSRGLSVLMPGDQKAATKALL